MVDCKEIKVMENGKSRGVEGGRAICVIQYGAEKGTYVHVYSREGQGWRY